MRYSKGAHSIYYTRYHLVFSTRYRHKIIKHGLGAYVQGILIKSFQRRHPEFYVIEVKTDEDHVHLLCGIPPKISVSNAVRFPKGYSAHAMHQQFKFLDNVFYGSDGIWSDGYFISTVGVDEKTIRKYIEYQGTVDRGQAEPEF